MRCELRGCGCVRAGFFWYRYYVFFCLFFKFFDDVTTVHPINGYHEAVTFISPFQQPYFR